MLRRMLVCVGGLVAGAAAQERTVPARLPILPPTREWFDAGKVQSIVDELRPMVERHAGLRFLRDPVVRVAR